MNQNNISEKIQSGEPILDFISGKTNTSVAKRVTKNISSLYSLWQLAKMARIVNNYSKE